MPVIQAFVNRVSLREGESIVIELPDSDSIEVYSDGTVELWAEGNLQGTVTKDEM